MEENEEEEDNDNYPMFDEHGGTSMGEDEVEEDEKKMSLAMIFVRPFMMHKWTVEVKTRG